jgi:two-component system sensor histidine kinase KdpD
LNRNWYAVYVQTPAEEPTVIDTHTQQIISSTLTLAKQLGAIVFTYKGEDVVRTLLQFTKEYRVGHIVIGHPRPRSLWKRVRGKTGMVERLIREAKGITVTVLDTREEGLLKAQPVLESEEIRAAVSSVSETATRLSLRQLLSPERIVIWNEPVRKETILRRLVGTMGQRDESRDSVRLLDAILEREEQGSTFFNEGAAFPHVRVKGLTNSIVSLGLTRQGVSDEPTEKPVELVFLILSPAENPGEQTKILALASRAAQNRYLLQSLRSARTSEEAMRTIRDWGGSNDSNK